MHISLAFPCTSMHQAKFVVGELSAGGFLCKGLEENPGDSWLEKPRFRTEGGGRWVIF